MSLVANVLNGEFKTLRIISSSPNVQITFQNKMLKDMEQYSAVVRTFYTNAVPSLIPEDVTLLKFFPKDDLGEEIDAWDTYNHFIENDHQLIIKRNETHNILGLVYQISKFCDKINKNIYLYGSRFGANAAYYMDAEIDPAAPAIIINDVAAPVNIAFSIDSNGRALFKCSRAFLSQWYIELDLDFANLIGLPQYLWAGEALGTLVHAGDAGNSQLFVDGEFIYSIQSLLGVGFRSNRSMFLADRRESLVVEMSMPFSRTIHSENGKHVEKYRLCEFPIDNYIQNFGSIQSQDGSILATVKNTDTLQGGLTDFTKGFPETHVVHFLGGDLYTANTRIYIVYNVGGVKVEKPFELGDGFYDIEVLFIKKRHGAREQQGVPETT